MAKNQYLCQSDPVTVFALWSQILRSSNLHYSQALLRDTCIGQSVQYAAVCAIDKRHSRELLR